jgi:uncharacterized membrane protein
VNFILFIGSLVVGFVFFYLTMDSLSRFMDNKEDRKLGLVCVIYLTLTLIFLWVRPLHFMIWRGANDINLTR